MTLYHVRVGLLIVPDDETDDIDVFTDKLMDELIALNEEADLGGSVASGHFDVSVLVEASAPLDALQLGTVIIKTAAHAAGGHTQGLSVPQDWPGWIHEDSLAADPVKDDQGDADPELVCA